MHAAKSAIGVYSTGPVTCRDVIVNRGTANPIYTDFNHFDLKSTIDVFKGRDDKLNDLETCFFKEKVKMVVISGISGIGKTELAAQFAKNVLSNNKIDKVLWMKAGSENELQLSFKNLANRMCLNINLDNKSRVDEIYNHLEQYKCLYVFDNVEKRKHFSSDEVRKIDNFYYLITTHKNDWVTWDDQIKSVELKELSREAAVEVLTTMYGMNYHYNSNYRKEYEKLAEILSDIPLALQICTAYIRKEIKRTRGSFDLRDYVRNLESSMDEIIDIILPGNSPNTFNKSIFGAIKYSLGKLQNDEDDRRDIALEILYFSSFLNSEYINFKDLLIMLTDKEEKIENSKIKLTGALTLAEDFSFIRYNKENVNIHRLLQAALRSYLDKECNFQKNKCYLLCLKLLLSGRHLHLSTVLKFADYNLESFREFVLENKNQLYENHYSALQFTTQKNWTTSKTKLQIFMKTLITEGCIKTIELIFNTLKKSIYKYIIEFDLLKVSIESNNLQMLKLLLKKECNINSRSEKNRTPLHVASFNWNLKAVEILLDRNADLEARDSTGSTALFAFFRGGISQENVNQDTMNKFVNLLQIEKNIDIINNNGETLLHEASASFQEEAVKLLVNNYNINVNITDQGNWSPFHEVIFRSIKRKVSHERVIKTVQTLIDCKVPLEKNTDGMTPRVFAEFCKVNYLIEHLKTEAD